MESVKFTTMNRFHSKSFSHSTPKAFPKTDYTYSKFSPHHREISPGVMTAPNMSRPSIHHIPPFTITPLAPNSGSHKPRVPYDFNDSDSDDTCFDQRILRNAYTGHKTTSIWRQILTFLWTSVTTILTSITSVTRSTITSVSDRVLGPRPRRDYMLRTSSQQSSLHQSQNAAHKLASPFKWLWSYLSEHITRTSLWLMCSVRSIWSTDNTLRRDTRYQGKAWNPLLLLLIPLFLILVWWSGDYLPSVSPVFESLGQSLLDIIALPVTLSRLFLSWMWLIIKIPSEWMISLWNYISAPLETIPSSESFMAVISDIGKAPGRLILALWDTVISFGGIILSLFNMLISLLTSKSEGPLAATQLPPDSHIQFNNYAQMSSKSLDELLESQALRAIVTAAIHERDESLRSEMQREITLREKTLRAEMEDSLKRGHQITLEVLSLKDELRRLRRRVGSCCSMRSLPPTMTVLRNHVQEEVNKALSSPEALLLLKAATDRYGSALQENKLNDFEMKAWVKSIFLERDNFERALGNLTRQFYDELDRRNAIMMKATSDEINAQIKQQQWNTMRELRTVLSDAHHLENDRTQNAASYSTGETNIVDESRVRRIVQSALALYDADKTGMADYALESQGGQIISTRCTETYQVKSPTLSVFGVPLWYPSNSPRTVIQPGMHPGECWAFVGSQGFLVVQLSHRIKVKGFTYEHISPVLLPTGKVDSAPKEFSVYGLRSEVDNDPILMGTYHYLDNSTSLQYFAVQRTNVPPVQLVELRVTSNHGNINYTCLYRFRVHGTIA